MVAKLPGIRGFLSMAIGVFALYIDALSAKHLSASFIVLGIVGLYISFYNANKGNYIKAGEKLTQLFNNLKQLYFTVKTAEQNELISHQEKLSNIEKEFSESCVCKHLIFSGWYAHYKFFWQQQIEWIDEQKNFKFLRDKVPLSLSVTMVVFIVLLFIYGFGLFEMACGYAFS